MPAGSSATRTRLDSHASTTSRSPASRVARSHSGTSRSRHVHSARLRASSTAASMSGSAGGWQAADHEVGARGGHGKGRLEQFHAEHQAADVTGHRPDGVEARRQRPHPVERHPSPGGLEAGDTATGGRNTDGPAGVAAVGHVGFPRGDGDGRSARRPTGDEGGIERVHRRAEPGVDAGHSRGPAHAGWCARRCEPRPLGLRPGRRHRSGPGEPARPPPGSRPWWAAPPYR